MKTLPKNVTAYKKTPDFDELNVPNGLLNAHQTKKGVWGKIVILEGQLQYTINEPEIEIEIIVLTENSYGVVEPEIFHDVKPLVRVLKVSK